jgi:hypothetical protein
MSKGMTSDFSAADLFCFTDLRDGLGSLEAHLRLYLAPEATLHVWAGGGGQQLDLLDPA